MNHRQLASRIAIHLLSSSDLAARLKVDISNEPEEVRAWIETNLQKWTQLMREHSEVKPCRTDNNVSDRELATAIFDELARDTKSSTINQVLCA